MKKALAVTLFLAFTTPALASSPEVESARHTLEVARAKEKAEKLKVRLQKAERAVQKAQQRLVDIKADISAENPVAVK